MGAKLTKSKTLSISGKTKEQQMHTATTVENGNNQLDLTVNDDGQKQPANNKNKKTKEIKSNKKSSQVRVDKSTNTDNCVLPSSSFTEQLVGEKASTQTNQICSDGDTVQTTVSHPSTLLSKDAQELRDACFQNGIISAESFNEKQQELNEDSNQDNNSNITEVVTHNISATSFSNIDLAAHGKEHSVES